MVVPAKFSSYRHSARSHRTSSASLGMRRRHAPLCALSAKLTGDDDMIRKRLLLAAVFACVAGTAVAQPCRNELSPGPSCNSRYIRTCCDMAAAMPWRTRATTHGRYRLGSGTRTSSTQCAIPSWRRIGSKTSGDRATRDPTRFRTIQVCPKDLYTPHGKLSLQQTTAWAVAG
jgi:hypothetical protein